VLPAAIAWLLLGLFANLLPLSTAALILTAAYGVLYGIVEVAGRSFPAPPSMAWQVPSPWVTDVPRWRRALTWGALLGPGFATRNPYAGFGVLPLGVAAVGSVRSGVAVAVSIGIAHGGGRALALLRDVRHVTTADYLQSVLRSMHWRTFDGFALLMVSGAAVLVCVFRL
jgi:hypothetical protein